jgi:hypothetical protein
MRGLALMAMLGVGLAACTSPEATRMRAGGPGADVGNKPTVVVIHEGSRPFYRTPTLIGDVGLAAVDTGQADRPEGAASSRPRSRGEGSASPRSEK